MSDISTDAVGQARSRFRVPFGSTDTRQLVEETRPDIVDVCTPPRSHLEVAVMAMERGCNVIMEKPMAPSL